MDLPLWEPLLWIILYTSLKGVIPLTITSNGERPDYILASIRAWALSHRRSSGVERRDFKHKEREDVQLGFTFHGNTHVLCGALCSTRKAAFKELILTKKKATKVRLTFD